MSDSCFSVKHRVDDAYIWYVPQVCLVVTKPLAFRYNYKYVGMSNNAFSHVNKKQNKYNYGKKEKQFKEHYCSVAYELS